MDKRIRLQEIRYSEVGSVCMNLRAQGFAIYAIGTVSTSEDFLRQAKNIFPLDPSISGRVHWDAFADSLWGGLDACSSSRIALVVEDAREFIKFNRRDYAIALDCLVTAAEEVECEKLKEGQGDSEIIVVIGIE